VPLPHRALVVDDSAGARHRVATLLTLAGYQVLEVVGADAALRSAARFRPDLVVTAVRMRSGDGLALLQQLRRHGSQARFVALTSRPDAQVHAAVAALGGACLGKPVDPRQLVELLRGRTTGPAAQGTTSAPLRVTAERLAGAGTAASGPAAAAAADDGEDDVPGWADQQRAAHLSRLPYHLAWIADHARASTASAVAADAGRGVLSQPRLMQLVMLTSAAR
jgi:CheY-like chemotaxis protein